MIAAKTPAYGDALKGIRVVVLRHHRLSSISKDFLSQV
jgi:hypothetical protein